MVGDSLVSGRSHPTYETSQARGFFPSSLWLLKSDVPRSGEVIAKASGSSWPDFIKSRILQPLDMQRTVTTITVLPSTDNVATPHKSELDSVHPIPWYNWDTMAAAGGIISSSNDMAKWLRVQLERGKIDDSNRLFSEASSHLMWSPHTVIPVSAAARQRIPSTHFRSYGLGWVLHDYKGRMVVSHGGGYDGMYSHVALVPDENLGIVVLTNSMTGISTPIANHIIDDYLGGESRDWSSEDSNVTSPVERSFTIESRRPSLERLKTQNKRDA